ncbi:MAG: EAL domain-containing protein [Proteobacteria bacterium]|nr:EAL domain-containing protein [Pseudomonadota bacterium]
MAAPEVERSISRRAAREAGIFGVLVWAAVSAGVIGLWISERNSLGEDFRHYLVGVAEVASTVIDPGLHAAIRRPDQLNGPDYRAAVAPLTRLKQALPDLRYVYTVVRDGGRVRFILESADPGATLPSGQSAQSGVWAVYDHTDPAMEAALGSPSAAAQATATDAPYQDEWGTFMTGWAPVADASGARAVVGVDIDATVYLERLRTARNWALTGLIPATLVIIVLGFTYYGIRRRGLLSTEATARAADAARRSASLLAMERERLNTIIEGTKVGTWELDVAANALVGDRTFKAMFGYGGDDAAPLQASEWLRLLHSDDRRALSRAVSAAAESADRVFALEARVRHRDGHWVWVTIRGRVNAVDARGVPTRTAGMHIDITARKAAELAMQDSEIRFRSLFEASPVGIALNDLATGRFLEFNNSLLEPTGYSRAELLGMSYWDLTPTEYSTDEAAQLDALATTSRYGPYEKVYRRKDGSTYPVLLSGIRMDDASGRAVIWSIVQDISQRKAFERELAAAATHDRLTGLANRAHFMEELARAVARQQSTGERPFAVLFLDFDRFKIVNDTLGHKAGDDLLQQIAARLRECVRASGESREGGDSLICRFGGDEFLVLLHGVACAEHGARVAERLLNHLARPYTISGNEIYSTASIGIVTSAQCCTSAEDIVRSADVAMYEAKRMGRACSVVFSEAMHTRLARNLTIDSELRRAIGTPELSLVYQPIVDLNSGRMKSAEALLRWNHPTLGNIPPSEFIPVAEETGLIVAVGQWVMNEACRTLVEWRQTDPEHAPETVSVNVSLAELSLGQRLLAQVERTLEATGLPARCLQLEVTEREVMRNPAGSLDLMRSLSEAGVRLAMDDFGTGTSSLAFLRDFPFHAVKIDQSFVRGLNDNAEMLAVIHATITLVENLGMTSVAEGVEVGAQAAILQAIGCRYAQGYLFSRPVPPGSLLASARRLATGRRAPEPA